MTTPASRTVRHLALAEPPIFEPRAQARPRFSRLAVPLLLVTIRRDVFENVYRRPSRAREPHGRANCAALP
jgi:hypothetical protein